MCPACLTIMALSVSGMVSTGGLSALVVKKVRSTNSTLKPTQPELKENTYVTERDRTTESRVAS
jgi:hypothetical protein